MFDDNYNAAEQSAKHRIRENTETRSTPMTSAHMHQKYPAGLLSTRKQQYLDFTLHFTHFSPKCNLFFFSTRNRMASCKVPVSQKSSRKVFSYFAHD